MDAITSLINQTKITDTGSTMVARSMKEVEAQVVLAKKFPRNYNAALQRIKDVCKSKKLAREAMYSYPRGGQAITGPSIKLIREIASLWGNIDCGVREIDQENGQSTYETYAWDLESNFREAKSFVIKHERHTRKGKQLLTDHRDVYELIANYGARRLRACLMAVIPLDVIEQAVDACQNTLTSNNEVPLKERIAKCAEVFNDKFSVSVEMLEGFLGHSLEETSEIEMVQLTNIYNSLTDKMSKREDWFKFKKQQTNSEASSIMNGLAESEKSSE
jgi:hypothetical protein